MEQTSAYVVCFVCIIGIVVGFTKNQIKQDSFAHIKKVVDTLENEKHKKR